MDQTDQTLYARTLREVKDAEAMASPAEDMAHARMLLDQLTPTELLQATFLLEEFLEQTPAFRESLERSRKESGSDSSELVSMEEVLAEHGFHVNAAGKIASNEVPHKAA